MWTMNLLDFAKHQLDRLAAWVAIAIGLILLCAGWFGASGADTALGAIPYLISGGIGGLFLLGFGATLWLSADMRDEWRKLDRLERLMTGTGRPTTEQSQIRDGRDVSTDRPAATGQARDRVAVDAGRNG
jgi:hypothetical protein